MTFSQVLFKSVKQDWETPKEVYDTLNQEFNFDFDPCPSNATFDGLNCFWKKRNFVNPPYKEIKKWIEKGWKESQLGRTVVFLIPSRTDTKWWHNYVMKAKEIRFIQGRLKFSGHKNSAPFPSRIVIFNGRKVDKRHGFD